MEEIGSATRIADRHLRGVIHDLRGERGARGCGGTSEWSDLRGTSHPYANNVSQIGRSKMFCLVAPRVMYSEFFTWRECWKWVLLAFARARVSICTSRARYGTCFDVSTTATDRGSLPLSAQGGQEETSIATLQKRALIMCARSVWYSSPVVRPIFPIIQSTSSTIINSEKKETNPGIKLASCAMFETENERLQHTDVHSENPVLGVAAAAVPYNPEKCTRPCKLMLVEVTTIHSPIAINPCRPSSQARW